MIGIRPATLRDAEALAAILTPEIEGGYAHFGTVPATPEQCRRDLLAAARYPVLVAEQDGVVVGTCKAGPHKTRGGYAWSAEVGVYIPAEHQRKGIGRLLLSAMLTALEDAGFRTVVAGIALPNTGSVALFEGAGFEPVGVFERVGHKLGDWRDVGYWALHLGDGPPGDRPTAPLRQVPLVQVDAFADRAFEGNPAAVVRLPDWLPDATLAAIAAENNLSETAFVVHRDDGWHLRWFTPTVEVDLCGHATLAAGYVLLGDLGGEHVDFRTRSGILSVERAGGGFAMSLPSHPVGAPGLPDAVVEALGTAPLDGWSIKALHHADYYLARYADAATVATLRPDLAALGALRTNVICTAPGEHDLDFVSRFFAPGSGVPEDPVTGSAHATLTPFWVDRLGRNPLVGRQISARGGTLHCRLEGDRVVLTAGCVETVRGVLTLPEPVGP